MLGPTCEFSICSIENICKFYASFDKAFKWFQAGEILETSDWPRLSRVRTDPIRQLKSFELLQCGHHQQLERRVSSISTCKQETIIIEVARLQHMSATRPTFMESSSKVSRQNYTSLLSRHLRHFIRLI